MPNFPGLLSRGDGIILRLETPRLVNHKARLVSAHAQIRLYLSLNYFQNQMFIIISTMIPFCCCRLLELTYFGPTVPKMFWNRASLFGLFSLTLFSIISRSIYVFEIFLSLPTFHISCDCCRVSPANSDPLAFSVHRGRVCDEVHQVYSSWVPEPLALIVVCQATKPTPYK